MPEAATQSKIAIVTFNQGTVNHAFTQALIGTFEHFDEDRITWLHMPTYDKNALLPMIERGAFDVVVWINPNIIWTADALRAVLTPVQKGDAQAAGCLYHVMREDGGLIPTKLKFFDKDLDPLRGYVGPTHESGRFMYLRACRLPFGFLAVKGETLLKASALAPQYNLHGEGERETRRFFDARVEHHELVDEDHIACDYLRVAGAEIWVSMDEAVLQVIGGRAIGKPNEPPRIHEYAAECAKAKVKK